MNGKTALVVLSGVLSAALCACVQPPEAAAPAAPPARPFLSRPASPHEQGHDAPEPRPAARCLRYLQVCGKRTPEPAGSEPTDTNRCPAVNAANSKIAKFSHHPPISAASHSRTPVIAAKKIVPDAIGRKDM